MGTAKGFQTNRKRTPAQKSASSLHLELASRAKTQHPDKENIPPVSHVAQQRNRLPARRSSGPSISSSSEALTEKLRADSFERQFRNERKKANRAKCAREDLKEQVRALNAEIRNLKTSSSTYTLSLLHRLEDTKTALANLTVTAEALREQNTNLSKSDSKLEKRLSRVRNQIEKEASHSMLRTVKEKGVIRTALRTCIRELAANGAPVDHIWGMIQAVAKAFDIELVGEITTRSVARIIGEGGVAANLQITDEIGDVKYITLSGDGSSHKHRNYESRHVALTINGRKVVLFLGISNAPNHTSEEQLKGWEEIVNELYGHYNASPLGREKPLYYREFWTKVVGMITDHANDQKKLKGLLQALKAMMDREIRGEKALCLCSPPELLRMIGELNEAKIARAGGIAGWDALSIEEQASRNAGLHAEMCQQYGQIQYEALSKEQQDEVDFFIAAGCCMHKDLNCHKAGAVRMALFWEAHGLEGPVVLMYKDNAAAAALGAGAAKERAEKVSSRGGVKVTELMGMLLNHKDDKKGQQDSHGIYFSAREHIGYFARFPDTSNNRYTTHSEAAAELIIYLSVYIEFLEFVRDRKESIKFNHMELNVWKALHDNNTISELCALTVYGQSVTRPYMRVVRGSPNKNFLDLGPLHQKVIAFCKKIISRPELLFGPSMSHTEGSVDGQPWDRPEAMYTVARLACGLPHLRGLIIWFFEGALEAWERFAVEFTSGGQVDQLTPSQKDNAWMPTTNDHNEGGLGALRQAKRRAPNATLEFINAKSQYKRNNTEAFIDAKLSTPEAQAFLRRTAREINSEGRERKRRRVEAEADELTVSTHREKQRVLTEKKTKAQNKVDNCVRILDISIWEDPVQLKKITVPQIDLQLKWHRNQESKLSGTSEVPAFSHFNKAQKVALVVLAVKRWKVCLDEGKIDTVDSDPEEGGEQVESEEEEEDIGYTED